MRTKLLLPFLILNLLILGCGKNYVPKPKAYFRIAMPEKKYHLSDSISCPFTFELPQYAIMQPAQKMPEGDRCWSNIYFPRYRAEILLTYKAISPTVNLQSLIEDLHKTAYSHQIKAEKIETGKYEDPSRDVYALSYFVKGEVASQVQFCVTDSTNHFIRGSLYFLSSPNPDSLAPVVDYLTKDIDHIIKTLIWK